MYFYSLYINGFQMISANNFLLYNILVSRTIIMKKFTYVVCAKLHSNIALQRHIILLVI